MMYRFVFVVFAMALLVLSATLPAVTAAKVWELGAGNQKTPANFVPSAGDTVLIVQRNAGLIAAHRVSGKVRIPAGSLLITNAENRVAAGDSLWVGEPPPARPVRILGTDDPEAKKILLDLGIGQYKAASRDNTGFRLSGGFARFVNIKSQGVRKPFIVNGGADVYIGDSRIKSGIALDIPGLIGEEAPRNILTARVEYQTEGNNTPIRLDISGATSFTDTASVLDRPMVVTGSSGSSRGRAVFVGTRGLEFLDPSGSVAEAQRMGFIVVQAGPTPAPKTADFDDDGEVNFNDFFMFAFAFGQPADGENAKFDLSGDGVIGFDDFFVFAAEFGKKFAAGKPVAGRTPAFGVNRDAGLTLTLASERVLPGQPISLDVAVSNATALTGYGFTLTYDPEKFELVEVTAGDQNLLSQGGNTPVFLKNAEPGRIQVANAIAGAGAVVGSGNVARLVFTMKGQFEDATRFEIADGILVDGSRLLNPVVTLGALNVQTTPTKFALKQNFPNPFNPETTIGYNLAADGQVELRIYNLQGQVVRTLVNERRQAAGPYSVRWDGRDDLGRPVASGVYVYRLRSGSQEAVRKMIFLK